MHHDFDRLIDRRTSDSMKWIKYRDRDIIPMWVADMDFVSPPAVIDALTARVAHGVFGYAKAPKALAETVVERMRRCYDWAIEEDWIVWLPGVVTGLNVACRCIGKPGDGVMTMTPIYPPFMVAPGFSDREGIFVPLRETGTRWTIDEAALDAALTPTTRLFLLCHPHNPVGRLFDREELSRFLAFCEARDLVVCSDEIHCDLVLTQDRPHIPFASLSPDAEARTISLFAPSKTYNIPGLGCAFAVIADPDLRKRFRQSMEGIVPEVNLLGYTAALAAYREGDDWLAQVLEYLRGNRDRIYAAVARMPNVTVAPVEATYLAWLDMRQTGISDPARFFEDAGVGLADGANYGAPGFVRLNFGCPKETLDRALERMIAAMPR